MGVRKWTAEWTKNKSITRNRWSAKSIVSRIYIYAESIGFLRDPKSRKSKKKREYNAILRGLEKRPFGVYIYTRNASRFLRRRENRKVQSARSSMKSSIPSLASAWQVAKIDGRNGNRLVAQTWLFAYITNRLINILIPVQLAGTFVRAFSPFALRAYSSPNLFPRAGGVLNIYTGEGNQVFTWLIFHIL